MKLIIDIPKEEYKRMTEMSIYSTHAMICAIQNGIPLDDVKVEIAEEICLTNNPYTEETKYTIEHLRLIEILDNIGKAETPLQAKIDNAKPSTWLTDGLTEEEVREEVEKGKKRVCGRNICIKNEYSGIGCDKCEVNTESEDNT